jgi:hypothetical protein
MTKEFPMSEAIARVREIARQHEAPVCDWEGNPAFRPLTGMGEGHVIGKGFVPRNRTETAVDTFATASAIWRHAKQTGARGVMVQAFWTDCCGHKHLLFHNGKDCRLLARAQSVADGYQSSLESVHARVAEIAVAQSETIEPVRYGRDVTASKWVDPVQANQFAKTPEKVKGFRRIDTLVRLLAGGTLTKEHVAAGFRLRDDYEVSEGARPGSERSEIRGSGTGGPLDAQLAAVARYRAAIQAVGKIPSAMVLHVVLDNRSITAWAEPRGMSVSSATGYLLCGMDRLQEHYGHSIEHRDIQRVEDTED